MEDIGEVMVSLDLVIGLIAGVLIPLVLFFWRIHHITTRTHEMHVNPDDFGFGTGETNQLLAKHMKDEEEMHRVAISTSKRLDYTIKELTHYIRWGYREQHGKEAPPYVRGHDDAPDP